MAITIINSPSGEPTVQDDLWHIAASDNSGTTDMKYVFDVWVNRVQQIRVKQYPDPVNGQAYFNAAPIVRNGFSYEWFAPSSANGIYLVQPNASGEISQVYQVRYGEDVSGVTTTNIASGEVSGFNYVPPVFQRRVQDMTAVNNRFVSNRPRNITTRRGQRILIPFRDTGTAEYNIETYDHSNTLITTVQESAASRSGFWQLDIGEPGINTAHAGLIDDSVKYYKVWFTSNPADVVTVTLECNPKYTPYNIYFLNAWGMFDTACFGLVSKLTKDVERKSFSDRDFRQGPGAVTYYDSNNVYHESKINYSNKADHSLRLTMNAPTDGEWQWLAELLSSPQMFMEQDGYFYPVTIKNTTYEYSTYINNNLRPFEIDVEINQTRWSQLR